MARARGHDGDPVAAGRAGRLRVGFASSASYSILPSAVRLLREQAPEVDLQLVPLTSGEQVDGLHDGSLDIGVVRGEALDLTVEPLFAEELVACLPAGHPLPSVVEPRDLAAEPMIFFPARDMPGFVAEIRPIFAGLPFPSVRARAVHQETALGFVAAGLGFTILPASISAYKPDAVRVARIATRPRTTMGIALPSGSLTPAAETSAGRCTRPPESRRADRPPAGLRPRRM